MAGDAGPGTAGRELFLVLAVAVVGLLLAVVAAFTPWHAAVVGSAPAGLVEMHVPDDPGSAPGGSH
ncbi:hypothetical protein [Micromonospora globbae]|jgi:hypothetical protein|uniref:Uncharacterized protein n=1 Tax=Micromonospora globbae TaxID=1894969 RepID=A0A420F1G7_9ACTN|nr:hypothetical protein [Micromonospora globbae]RKF26778.1 hypothetical protein D7I43_14435 [Micromonospora globbae]